MIDEDGRCHNRLPERDIDMVFFDAGETLIHPRPSFPQLFASVCGEFGVRVDLAELAKATRRLMSRVEEEQRKGYTFTDDPERSRRFWLDFYRELACGFGYRGGEDGLPHRLYEVFSLPDNYTAYSDAVETLWVLGELGISLGLISNFEPWLHELLERLGLAPFFKVVVVSGEVGMEKPNPGIFRLALQRAGVDAERALHVGDSPVSDYRGAREAGMRAILLDRWGRFPDFEGEKVNDLRELLFILD